MKAAEFSILARTALWLVPAILSLSATGAEPVKQGRLFGKPAPAFQVQGIYGENLSLDTFKGHILVIQFGTSW